MLTSQKVIDAINQQIGNEFGASIQYVAIAAYFGVEALPQLAQHFFRQADEEKEHALRFINYVVDAGGRVVIPAITAPQSPLRFRGGKREALVRPGGAGDTPDQCPGRAGALRERLHHDQFPAVVLAEQLEEVSSMDTLLRMVQRSGGNLLLVEEYLARVGLTPRGLGAPK